MVAPLALVVLAAAIHATWNLFAKRSAHAGVPLVFAYNVVAVVAYAACVAIAAALAVRVLLDPEGVLGPVAAARVGRTGSVETVAEPTIWPWVALAACLVALLGLAGAVVGMRRWGGPSQRYEVPEGVAGDVAGPRGERVTSDWDELSAGRDPTDVGPDAPT